MNIKAGQGGHKGRPYTDRFKVFIGIILLIGIFNPAGSAEGEEAASRNEAVEVERSAGILGFAQGLEKEGDFYRAITEYKRVIYLRESPGDVRAAHMGICRSYTRGRKWVALEASTLSAQKEEGWNGPEGRALKLMRALALWNLLRFKEAQGILGDIPSEELGKEGHLLSAWVNAACSDLAAAREHFGKTEYSPVDPKALEAFPPQEQKPWVAGTLSALLPGAGQLYAGKPQAAMGAFLVNAVLIAATIESFDEDHEVLGAGIGFLAMGFYIGNIYGAVNYVASDNRLIETEPDAWLAKKSGLNESFRESVELSVTTKF